MPKAEDKQPSIKCPRCGMVSYNPNDIRTGFCGKCCEFTGEAPPPLKMGTLDVMEDSARMDWLQQGGILRIMDVLNARAQDYAWTGDRTEFDLRAEIDKRRKS